jgi:tetratricopeptide (TPR) repeat protein
VSETLQKQPGAAAALTLPELLARAQAALAAGQAAAAGQWCDAVLARWPGQGDAAHMLGLIAHGAGRLWEALAQFRVAARAPRAPGLYAANLAEACRLAGRLEEGEAAGRLAVARAPGLAAAWNNLGIILQESGKFAESRDCLRRVLTLQPGNAEAHNNLGNTLKRLGLGAEAEAQWRRAIALRPDYPQPHSNLCSRLAERGAYEEALAHGRRAIALAPLMADAYVNLAGLENLRLNHEAALAWLDRLLGFAPDHAVGLAARAMVLKKLDRLDEALAASERAIALAPDNAEAHHAKGAVLHELGQVQAALEHFARAAALPGTAAEQALTSRAVLLMEQGERDAAEAAFNTALAAFPRAPSIWFNRADLRKFSPGDPDIAAMEALLAGPEAAAPSEAMLLHFALGKAWLDAGDADAAFQHFGEGNRLKRASFAYDPAIATALVDELTSLFTPALLTAKAGAGPGSSLPIFVVGMPRSGTSLVEQLLASHSVIQGGGELAYLQRLTAALSGYPGCVAGMGGAALHGLGEAYLARLAPLAAGHAHVVDKMPANFVFAGLIRLILPGARIIHCRRDAADTCLSCYTKLFSGEQLFAYDQSELGLFHRDYERLMAHWRLLLPPSHFHELHYEKLVGDFENEARRLLDFLGLGWEDSCLTFHETSRLVRTASLNQVRQPLYASATGRWRRHAGHLQPLLAALRALDDPTANHPAGGMGP